MTDVEIEQTLKQYDGKIKILARMVAKQNKDVVDDLAQIGRQKLWEILSKNLPIQCSIWTYAERSIIAEMCRAYDGGTTTTSDKRRKPGFDTIELDENLAEPERREQDPVWESLLQAIEAEIEKLPYQARRKARAYLATLSGDREKRKENTSGKPIIEKIIAKYRAEYEKIMGDV